MGGRSSLAAAGGGKGQEPTVWLHATLEVRSGSSIIIIIIIIYYYYYYYYYYHYHYHYNFCTFTNFLCSATNNILRNTAAHVAERRAHNDVRIKTARSRDRSPPIPPPSQVRAARGPRAGPPLTENGNGDG